MELKYPDGVAAVIARLDEAGYAAYIVGGALRDALLGREAHDFDVTTSALPGEVISVFADCPVIETGLQHGTVTVLIDGNPIEITTFRIDGEYRDARHPERVTFTDRVEGDLARRDFTVNAMAYNPKRGLVDVFGGREDLATGVIRAVGDPCARFYEDALRILRAFRFMAKLDFDIEPHTLAAAKQCRGGLGRISAERITAELIGLFEGKRAGKALLAMSESGIFDAIAPDFEVPPCPDKGIDALPPVFELRFARFLRGCADGGEGLISRLRLSNASRSRVRGLLRLSAFDFSHITEARIRRFLATAGVLADDAECLIQTGGFFDIDCDRIDTVISMMHKIRERGDYLSIADLAVNGTMLAEIGLRGREIGDALAHLFDRVLEDPSLNQKDTLLSIAKTSEF